MFKQVSKCIYAYLILLKLAQWLFISILCLIWVTPSTDCLANSKLVCLFSIETQQCITFYQAQLQFCKYIIY